MEIVETGQLGQALKDVLRMCLDRSFAGLINNNANREVLQVRGADPWLALDNLFRT